MALTHKDCGGLVLEDRFMEPTPYEHDDGRTEWVFDYRCFKCGSLIEGDADIEGLDEGSSDEGQVTRQLAKRFDEATRHEACGPERT